MGFNSGFKGLSGTFRKKLVGEDNDLYDDDDDNNDDHNDKTGEKIYMRRQ